MKRTLFMPLMAMLSVSIIVMASGCKKPENIDTSSYVETIEYEELTMQTGVEWGLGGYSYATLSFDGENLVGGNTWSGGGDKYDSSIADIGKAEGVSSINTIPSSFSESAECIIGNGYVVRVKHYSSTNYYGYNYIRLFVTEIVTDESGNALAVKLRYASLEI